MARPYKAADYTYKGIADCDIVENSDGTVDYNITLKEGVKFSDGEEMTIDDVIFSYYVLLDPAYDGVSTLYSLPIKGLDASTPKSSTTLTGPPSTPPA